MEHWKEIKDAIYDALDDTIVMYIINLLQAVAMGLNVHISK